MGIRHGLLALLDEGPAYGYQLKAAFDDLVGRYPDARNKNLYGTFACRARDREATARMLNELKARASFWAVQGITAEGCRRFALDPA